MKPFAKDSSNAQPQKILTALILTGIVSVGSGLTLIKSSAAADKRPLPEVAQESVKQNATSDRLPSQVADAVLRNASEVSGLPKKALNIVTFIRTQWASGCERPTFPRPCDQVLVRGWEVVVGAGDNRWIYFTNEDGSQVKLSEKGTQATLPKSIIGKILVDASQWSGLSTQALRIIKVESQTWGNPCMFGFRQICTREYNPVAGWEVTVDSGTQKWLYRVDDKATSVLLDRTPSLAPKAAEAIKKDAARFSASSNLRIIAVERRDDWNGVCEGVSRCTRPIASGWQATVSNGRDSYVYRVKEDGSEFEFQSLASLPRSIVNAVLADAVQRTQTKAAASLKNIVQAERVVWNDGCMGLNNGGGCTRGAVHGWRVNVSLDKDLLVYHTDNDSTVKLNEAASQIGNVKTLKPVPIPANELPPPLDRNVVFREITSGGITGRTFETVLLNDGRLIRTRVGDANDSERNVRRLSRQQVRQFQQLLERQGSAQFKNLNYQSKTACCDIPTRTLTSRDGTVRYNLGSIDGLPANLQAVVEAWNRLRVSAQEIGR
jgi:hypothetical protein